MFVKARGFIRINTADGIKASLQCYVWLLFPQNHEATFSLCLSKKKINGTGTELVISISSLLASNFQNIIVSVMQQSFVRYPGPWNCLG